MNTKTIAGITFNESGIVVIRPFQQDTTVFPLYTEDDYNAFLKIAKQLIKSRMAHCYNQLHSNLSRATHITAEMIAWKDGHFSIPVWEELERGLQLTDVRDLTPLQAQQIIRTMIKDNPNWVYDYDTITWIRIDKSEIRISDAFKCFITERMFITKFNPTETIAQESLK